MSARERRKARNALTVVVSLAATFGSAACQRQEQAPSTLFAIGIDGSSSTRPEDSPTCQASISAILRAATHGDRIAVLPIGRMRLRDIGAVADVTIPARTRVELDDEALVAEATARVLAATDSLLNARLDSITDIVATLVAAGEIFAVDARTSRTLLLCSDMLAEATSLNLMKTRPDSTFASVFVKKAREEGWLPDLRGVRVIVTGAGDAARDVRGFADLRAFWESFFTATGATLYQYGRAPLAAAPARSPI